MTAWSLLTRASILALALTGWSPARAAATDQPCLRDCPQAPSQNLPAVGNFSNGDPWYPLGPDGKKREGVVIVRLCLTEKAEVTDVGVESSSGFEELDQAAVRTSRAGQYKPVLKDGKPIAACRKLKFTYKVPHPEAESSAQ